MVTARCLPFMGGIETHVAEVARRLAGRGVDLEVLSTDVTGELPPEATVDGYRMRRFPAYPRRRDFYLSPALCAALAASRADLVHVQGVHNGVPPLALATAHLRRLPAVLTFHTGGHSSPGRSAAREAQWRLEAPLLRRCARLVAVCRFEQEAFARRLGLDPGAIALVRNGSEPLPVDPAAAVPDGAPLLCSVGRLERYKGHHRVIAALPAVRAEAPQARLVVAGAGPYEAELRDLARRLGVEGAVRFEAFGPEDRGGLGALLAASDAVALLSDYEAHPVAVMEALAAGTDVLAAATSGLVELGDAGLVDLVDPDADPAVLAKALLATAGRRRFSSGPPALPSWDDCTDELLAVYDEVAPCAS